MLEKTLESPLDCKEIKPGNPKRNQPWIFIGRTDAEAEIPVLWPRGEELTPWKRPWCWERLRAGGEGDDRGWDGWIASVTRWTWVWACSRHWWWTGRPGMLQSMGFQRADKTERLNWNEQCYLKLTEHLIRPRIILRALYGSVPLNLKPAQWLRHNHYQYLSHMKKLRHRDLKAFSQDTHWC